MRALEGNSVVTWISIFLPALGITTALYWPAHDAWFVADDHQWLSEVSLDQIRNFLTGSWGYGLAYRPLSRLSFALDFRLFGEDPRGWHFTNFALHAGNTAWLFLLSGLVSRQLAVRLLFALLFLISPLGHQNVAWISGRTQLLGGFFMLGALWFLLPGVTIEEVRRWRSVSAGLVLYAASLGSYEAALSLPLLIPVWIGISSDTPISGRLRAAWPAGAAILALIAGYLVARYLALGQVAGGVNRHHAHYFAGLFENLGTVLWTLFYQFRPGRFYAVLLVVGFGLVVVAWFLRREERGEGRWRLTWFLALVLAGLALYAPFSMVAGVAWRFLYLVQVAMFAAVCLAGVQLSKVSRWGAAISLVLLLPALCLSVSTSHRYAREWNEAGEMARRVVQEAEKLCEEAEPGNKCVVSGIPSVHKHALVFMTSFEVVLRRRCPGFSGRVYTDAEGESEPGRGTKASPEFRFDHDTLTFTRTSQSPNKEQ